MTTATFGGRFPFARHARVLAPERRDRFAFFALRGNPAEVEDYLRRRGVAHG